jgi:pimeloyl-ACP methyl ester carboxylesterase
MRTVFLPSSDGVTIALHDYDPHSVATPVLLAHATGFHGRCFDPVAAALDSAVHCMSMDFRGYGDATLPSDWLVRWSAYGDDALVGAQYAAATAPVIAAGHSMGAAALVMAALREPHLFAALVLYEPIIFPAEYRLHDGPNPLAEGARRRRTTFASRDEAYTNYATKPPLNVFHPDVLRAYVEFGFRDDPPHGVTLKCLAEHEARTYESGAIHDTWDRLGELTMPIWLVSGEASTIAPASLVRPLAEAISQAAATRCTLVEWGDLGHFGPMQDPARFASLITDVAREVA